MRPLSIRARLLAVLLVGVTGVIAIRAVSFAETSAALDGLGSQTGDLIELTDIANALAQTIMAEDAAIRDFLLGGGIAADLAVYESARTTEANLAGEFAALGATFPTINDEFHAVIEAAFAWRTGYVEPMRTLVAVGGLDEARQGVALQRGEALFATVRGAASLMQDDVHLRTESTLVRITDISRARVVNAAISVAILLVGTLVIAWFLTRWVARPLARLATTALQVEAGESVDFPSAGHDEIGTLARALERMRRALQQQAREASVINRFTEMTSFMESDGAVARATMQALEELTRPSEGAFHVADATTERGIPEASIGDLPPQVISLDTLAACPGVRRGGLHVTADLGDQLAVRCPVHGGTAGTLACIPMISLNEIIGAVHLRWDATDALPLDLQRAVSRIADHASLAVANRRLMATLQGQASTDGRTGLANSRFFDAALEEALTTRTALEPLAVLMLDVDGFKAFNDRHGHPAGDEALRALAGVLRTTVREYDLAARYGGEEFAMMLPGLDAIGGASVAERIRARIEGAIIRVAPGISDHVTISIGVAAYPADATNLGELVRAADAALYAAKKAGRNRVMVADAVGTGAPEEPSAPVMAVVAAGGAVA